MRNPTQLANGKGIEYIRYSRYSCLLCFEFLQQIQGIRTRGCHGKLYGNRWTLPACAGSEGGEGRTVAEAVMKLTSRMRKELIGHIKGIFKEGIC
jgi:hypothetical protein